MNLYQEKDLQDAEYWVSKSIKDVVIEKMQERKMSKDELVKKYSKVIIKSGSKIIKQTKDFELVGVRDRKSVV